MAFVAKRQMPIRLADAARCNTSLLAKPQQRRFMRKNELQYAGQKTRFARSRPNGLRFDAGEGQETRQKLRIGGNERQGLDCESLGVFV